MRIFLPPSETKRRGGGKKNLALESFCEPALNSARITVLNALQRVSSDRASGLRAFKLSEKQAGMLESNRELFTSPTMPAIERYTGVLFDALDVDTLPEQSRRWLNDSVFIQSAAFGRVSARDHIPNYRVSASSAVPGLISEGKPVSLKQFWQRAHTLSEASAHAPGHRPLTLDLRSKDYVALAPTHADAGEAVWCNILSRGADGTVKALNHFNKAAKGRLVRLMALTRPKIASLDEFINWAGAHDIECIDEAPGQLGLVADSVRLEADLLGLSGTQRNS